GHVESTGVSTNDNFRKFAEPIRLRKRRLLSLGSQIFLLFPLDRPIVTCGARVRFLRNSKYGLKSFRSNWEDPFAAIGPESPRSPTPPTVTRYNIIDVLTKYRRRAHEKSISV
ncbi:unnamed protein product, partial [Ascophyllum nodosum]